MQTPLSVRYGAGFPLGWQRRGFIKDFSTTWGRRSLITVINFNPFATVLHYIHMVQVLQLAVKVIFGLACIMAQQNSAAIMNVLHVWTYF